MNFPCKILKAVFTNYDEIIEYLETKLIRATDKEKIRVLKMLIKRFFNRLEKYYNFKKHIAIKKLVRGFI